MSQIQISELNVDYLHENLKKILNEFSFKIERFSQISPYGNHHLSKEIQTMQLAAQLIDFLCELEKIKQKLLLQISIANE